MCGICGFTGEANQVTLKRMTSSLYHRGPDEDGYYSDDVINLAIRRLSIVDVETGHQPIHNEDKSIWTVFNGEIYNFYEIREELEKKGHCFYTDHSDTEVIVHLYEEYGEDWPNYVNGMFGVAIWNSAQQKLSLYRDRIGKKPLYYMVKNSQIVFASEIKAILKHPSSSKIFDFDALYSYFGLKNTSAPRTAYSEIKQLLPGHVLSWHKSKVNTWPYWKLDLSSPLYDISEEEAAQHLLELLEDAVKIRMRCDVPYGAYLSGGVDSSSIVMLMSKGKTGSVKTFSLGYKDAAEGQFVGKRDDIVYARNVAKRLKTEHFEYIINAEQFAEQMPEIISAFDEPFSGTVSTYFLSVLIKKHVKVALSGDGADELFGSYLAHRIAYPLEKYLRLASIGKNDWSDLSTKDKDSIHPFDTPEQFGFLKHVASKNIAEWRENLSVFRHSERRKLLSPDFLNEINSSETRGIYKELKSGLTANDILNQSLEIDQKELLPNQVLPFVDRLSMAHSVEIRSPYLDYRIIEFANKLPGTLKIRNGTNKYIHKKAMGKILPNDILRRPKEGFVQPIYSWMHTSLKKWTLEQINLLPKEFFNIGYLDELTRKFQSGDKSLNAKVWNLACYSLWYQNSL